VIDSYLREAGIGNPPNGYIANTAGHLPRSYVEDEVARRYERFIRTAGADGPIVLDDVMRGVSGPQPVGAPHPEVKEAEAMKASLYVRVPVPDGAAQEIADKIRSLGGKTTPSENGYGGGENNVPTMGARFEDEKSARSFERWYNEQGYTGGDDERTLFVIAESVVEEGVETNHPLHPKNWKEIDKGSKYSTTHTASTPHGSYWIDGFPHTGSHIVHFAQKGKPRPMGTMNVVKVASSREQAIKGAAKHHDSLSKSPVNASVIPDASAHIVESGFGHAVVAFTSVDEAQDALAEFESIGIDAVVVGEDVLVTIDEKFGADDIDTFARFVTEGLGGLQVMFNLPADDEKIDGKGPKVSKKVGQLGAMSLVHESAAEMDLAAFLNEVRWSNTSGLNKQGVGKYGTYSVGLPQKLKGEKGQGVRFVYKPHNGPRRAKPSKWYRPDDGGVEYVANKHEKLIGRLGKKKKTSTKATPAAKAHTGAKTPAAPAAKTPAKKTQPAASPKSTANRAQKITPTLWTSPKNDSVSSAIDAYIYEVFKWKKSPGGWIGSSPEGHIARVSQRAVSMAGRGLTRGGQGQRYSMANLQIHGGQEKSWPTAHPNTRELKKRLDKWHNMFGAKQSHWKQWHSLNLTNKKTTAKTAGPNPFLPHHETGKPRSNVGFPVSRPGKYKGVKSVNASVIQDIDSYLEEAAKRHTPDRKSRGELAKDLRKTPTPSLSRREKNQAIRANLKSYRAGYVAESHGSGKGDKPMKPWKDHGGEFVHHVHPVDKTHLISFHHGSNPAHDKVFRGRNRGEAMAMMQQHFGKNEAAGSEHIGTFKDVGMAFNSANAHHAKSSGSKTPLKWGPKRNAPHITVAQGKSGVFTMTRSVRTEQKKGQPGYKNAVASREYDVHFHPQKVHDAVEPVASVLEAANAEDLGKHGRMIDAFGAAHSHHGEKSGYAKATVPFTPTKEKHTYVGKTHHGVYHAKLQRAEGSHHYAVSYVPSEKVSRAMGKKAKAALPGATDDSIASAYAGMQLAMWRANRKKEVTEGIAATHAGHEIATGKLSVPTPVDGGTIAPLHDPNTARPTEMVPAGDASLPTPPVPKIQEGIAATHAGHEIATGKLSVPTPVDGGTLVVNPDPNTARPTETVPPGDASLPSKQTPDIVEGRWSRSKKTGTVLGDILAEAFRHGQADSAGSRRK
jgi:hypothetical protein